VEALLLQTAVAEVRVEAVTTAQFLVFVLVNMVLEPEELEEIELGV
jgi:hypothetical protein